MQHFEIKVIDRNSILWWREVYLGPICITEDIENIQEIAAIAHSITQRKRTENGNSFEKNP